HKQECHMKLLEIGNRHLSDVWQYHASQKIGRIPEPVITCEAPDNGWHRHHYTANNPASKTSGYRMYFCRQTEAITGQPRPELLNFFWHVHAAFMTSRLSKRFQRVAATWQKMRDP